MTTNTRRAPTPKAVREACEIMRRLAQPTARERTERRFMDCKAAYTAATEALIREDVGAAERADAALASLNAAREALRGLAFDSSTSTEEV